MSARLRSVDATLAAGAGALVDGMYRDMEELHARFGASPEQELTALLLVGMEREQAATIVYDEARVLERLGSARLPERLRASLAAALRHVWLGEQMHARYLHGLLLRQPRLGTRLRTAMQMVSGSVGGWTASTQQFRQFRSAPLARSLAEAIEVVGGIAGKVPAEAKATMRYQSLAEYARFSVDAELSAVAGYERMVELIDEIESRGPSLLVFPPGLRDELRRAATEEAEHARLFALLVEALTPDDALAPGVDGDALAATIDELAREWDAAPAKTRHRLGAGGRVAVVRGASAGEKLECFRRALDRGGLREAVEERAAELGRAPGELTVAVKVDLMMGYDRADRSTVVDPELADALARYLREAGAGDVALAEARNLYEPFFAGRDVPSVARYFGFDSPSYRVVDLSDEQERHVFSRGMGHEAIGRTWREADLRISFVKLKTHPVEHFGLTIWNLYGVIPQDGSFVFQDRYAELHTAVMAVLHEFPVDFGVVDAYDAAADGLVGFMACPSPPQPRRFYAGRDLLAVDAVAARHTGVAQPSASAFYREATYWFGDPAARVEVDGPDEPVAPWRTARSGVRAKVLGALAHTMYERFSGRGALFAARMDERAFPPRSRSRALGLAREAVRRLMGV